MSRKPSRAAVPLVLVGLWLPTSVCHAQITLDGSLGPGGKLTGPNYVIGSDLGQIRGRNLFQSFGQFNVRSGESATFTGPNSIANIIGRVTGSDQSMIDGLLQSTIPGANLFLLNPQGVVFGPHATLSVTGAFHVSTANYLRFTDGAKFFTSLGPGSALTAMDPAAFGFLGPRAASVTLRGSTLVVGTPQTPQTLSLVGGDVEMTGVTLRAPGGRIQIASVASSGEVVPSGPTPGLGVSSFTDLGSITVSSRSLLDTSGPTHGTVLIRGGRLVVDNSTIRANTTASGDGPPLGIDIRVTGEALVSNHAALSSLTSGSGSGAAVSVTADRVTVTGGALINTESTGAGRGGDVTVTATGSFVLSGTGTALFTKADCRCTGITDRGGAAGDIALTAGDFTLAGGAAISSTTTLKGGLGGKVSVTAQRGVTLSGKDSFGNPSEILTQTSTGLDGGRLTISGSSLAMSDGTILTTGTGGAGRGGDIVVGVSRLDLAGGATIKTVTGREGRGGDVIITASESAAFSGGSTAILTASQTTGQTGDVSLSVGTLTLASGAQIQSGGLLAGGPQGGNVIITATGQVSISGGSGISSQASFQDVGQVKISAPTLFMNSRGFIQASTFGSRHGGDINIEAGQVQLADGARISATSTGTATALAGNVKITVGETFRMSHSTIATDAGVADGGNISLTGGHLVYLLKSGITASVAKAKGSGGNITIDPQFVVLDHSEVRADAFGGPGGHLDIRSDFFLTNRAVLSASSAQSTQGTIEVQSRFTDVSSSVAPLPAGLAQAATLLRASCAARVAAGKASSLVIAGREGTPPEPGQYMPSPLPTLEPGEVGSPGANGPHSETLPRLSLSVFSPACSR